jgi:hypothetical protein
MAHEIDKKINHIELCDVLEYPNLALIPCDKQQLVLSKG